jgi:methanogenic corrinoid protein MtbC1
MYTIKQASRLTGVSESSLRAWERRYGVVVPHRTESGYRLYDEKALATVSTMRRLVAEGWATAAAAEAVRTGTGLHTGAEGTPSSSADPPAAAYLQQFLVSAARMDTEGIEESLDGGFALGSFEHVIDTWLFPTLEALGEGWARGEIDVSGEHAASHAVHRRLSAAFNAAGGRSRGSTVVVGLPPGSHHSLGALAFATAIRRRGWDVLYLGADVPVASWEAAVQSRAALAAVMTVVMNEDRPAAFALAERLLTIRPAPIVCAGGAAGGQLTTGVRTLPPGIGQAANQLDDLAQAVDDANHTP